MPVTALPNTADRDQLLALAPRLISTCPDLTQSAHEQAVIVLKKHGVDGLDPDQVYYHRLDFAASNSKSFTGWEHWGKAHDSMTLTQLVIHRFRVTDQDNADLLDMNGGFYRVGPQATTFDDTNEVRLSGAAVLKDFWAIDFCNVYNAQVTAFWKTCAEDFRTLTKCNFLSQAIQARDKKHLDTAQLQAVIDAVAGNVSWPISLAMLQASTTLRGGMQVYPLQMANYVAIDILRIVGPGERQFIYVPGASPAFKVCNTAADLHWWVLTQMNDDSLRNAFLTHFSLADRQGINDQLTPLMNQLVETWGKSDHHLFNQIDFSINGDAFTWLRDSTRTAMFAEADLALVSNWQLRKSLSIGYLSAGLSVFGPLAMLGWPIALPVVGASLASLGLNIEKAIDGKTANERKEGTWGAVAAGIMTLFNLPLLKGVGPIIEVGPEVEAAEAADTATFRETPSEEPIVELTSPVVRVRPTAPSVPATWQGNELLDGKTPIAETGKFRGVYTVNAYPATAIPMNDATYYVRFESDANGGGGWAIVDPQNPNAFSGSIPVRLNAQGEWETLPRAGLDGGMLPTVNSNAPAPSYELPARLRPTLRQVAEVPGGGALKDEYEYDYNDMGYLSKPDDDPYAAFKALRRRLYQDAVVFFRNPSLPPRPPMPSLMPDEDTESLIRKLLEHARGLVLGENHSAVGSKQWLIENMPLLARQRVKTLYMEHLFTDLHQPELDTFARTGNMPKPLEKYLKILDSGHMSDPLQRNTFLEVVKAARRNNLRIQAIDCMASYRYDGMEAVTPEGLNTIDPTARGKMMNFYARGVIRADQAACGVHKWVALMGNTHANTYEGIPGVSELEEGIGLRVEDVAQGNSRGVIMDPGTSGVEGLLKTPYTLQSDFLLEMETPWAGQDDLEKVLPRRGMFTLRRSLGGTNLVHHARNDEIVYTLIETEGSSFFIRRPSWPSIDNRRFKSITALIQALQKTQMSLANWSPQL